MADAELKNNKKLKVGIIGTGSIAKAHIQQYLKMPDVEIVAGADIVPGRAEEFFKAHGVSNVRCYGKHTELIENEPDIDAVSICTYNRAHAECTVDCLNAGINVLLEKPMSVTLDEAVLMMKAEKKSGKVFSIGFQPRFNPNMELLKKIVRSGVLGEIYYIQTGGGRRHGIPAYTNTSFIANETGGIGALGDIGCYSLDMVLNAIGYPKPLTASGYTSDFFGKDPSYYEKTGHPEFAKAFGVDDFAAGFVRLEGGIILDFRISWAMHLDTTGDTLIMGKKAALRIPSTECWNGNIGGPMKLYHDVAGEQVVTEIPMLEDKSEGDFFKKIRYFLDAVKNKTAAPVPSSEIIYNQAILDGIARSAKLGREIAIEIPEIN